MKKNNIIYLLFLSLIFAVSSCVDNDPKIEDFPSEKVAFSYHVDGNDYQLDYFVGSTIQFTNESSATGTNYSWEFGDGKTSNEATPKHIFTNPGTYSVKLIIEGVGYRVHNILISDIVPVVKSTSEDPIVIAGKSLVQLDVTVPNPQGLAEQYEWIFPEGTRNESGQIVTTSSEKNPGNILFSNIGSQKVILKVKLGDRNLEEKVVNVHIGYKENTKTIYYAAKDGNIMALKVITNLPAGIKNNPFDLGVGSGKSPFNLQFYKDTLLYVLDAGRSFAYQNDVNRNLGDGGITVMTKDGQSVETMVSNKGGFAFDDPFYGYMDQDAGVLYVSDRNTGIAKLPVTLKNSSMDRAKYPFWVQNNTLGYYTKGIGYGAGNGNFQRVNNVWWWSKYFLSKGIFRFVDGDIGKTELPTSGAILTNFIIKSFVVDAKNKFVYLAIPAPEDQAGFYKVGLEELNTITDAEFLTKRVFELPDNGEGTPAEPVYISQMIVDEEDGSVYFGYRAGSGTSEKTGLKRYNPTTNTLETLVENVPIYGITINNNKSKLF